MFDCLLRHHTKPSTSSQRSTRPFPRFGRAHPAHLSQSFDNHAAMTSSWACRSIASAARPAGKQCLTPRDSLDSLHSPLSTLHSKRRKTKRHNPLYSVQSGRTAGARSTPAPSLVRILPIYRRAVLRRSRRQPFMTSSQSAPAVRSSASAATLLPTYIDALLDPL
jgi:hypothetical protein